MRQPHHTESLKLRRLEEVIRSTARSHGLNGDPLALTDPMGTYGQELTAATLLSDIPKEIRRGLEQAALEMVRACVLSSGVHCG